MADDQDQTSKTEDPTERKLTKLREEGNVPSSKEVGHLFALVGMALALVWLGPWGLSGLATFTAQSLENAGQLRLDGSAIGAVLSQALSIGLTALLPLLLLFMVLGIVGGIIQNGPLISSKPIQPSLEKISLIAGFGRLFSLRSVGEFVKSLVKLVVVAALVGAALWAYRTELMLLVDMSLGGGLTTVQRLMVIVVAATLALMVLLAIADVLFQRFLFLQQHRMSLKEIKDELKESEGDPYIKQRQKQIRMERARSRMMAAVPKASVVITNPTHYAVALRYDAEGGDAAPVLVAKGLDHVAEKIRDVAREHNVPLYEDPPLARQLYAQVELNEAIPIQLYEVVAKVIAFVGQLKARR